jgi:hypothetical protein
MKQQESKAVNVVNGIAFIAFFVVAIFSLAIVSILIHGGG